MYAIVLVGHGEISKGFLNAAEMIVGEQEFFEAIPLTPDDTTESYLGKLNQVTNAYDEVLVLADIRGGTPANVASYLVMKKNCIMLTGINLPLLLEILIDRMAGVSKEATLQKVKGLALETIVQITKEDLKRKE